MKKVKFMLMAIALVAVVGGALAFKANKMYNVELCYTTPVEGTCPLDLTCPEFDELRFNAGVNPTLRCTTTPDAEFGCDIDCIVTTTPSIYGVE